MKYQHIGKIIHNKPKYTFCLLTNKYNDLSSLDGAISLPPSSYIVRTHDIFHLLDLEDVEYIRDVKIMKDSKLFKISKYYFWADKVIIGTKFNINLIEHLNEWLNPSFCKKAIKINGMNIQYVPKHMINDKLINLAINITGNSIKYIENQDSEICLLAIKENPFSCQHIIDIILKPNAITLFIEMVKRNGETLMWISDYITKCRDSCVLEKIKQKMMVLCKLAVQQNGLMIQKIFSYTPEIAMIAVQQNGLALEYIEHQTYEICLLAVQQNAYAIEFVNKKFRLNVAMMAMQNNICAFRHLSYVNNDILFAACFFNGKEMLRLTKIFNYNVLRLAIRLSPFTVKHLYDAENKMELSELAVSIDGFALEFVETQTKKICEIAVRQNGEAIRFVENRFRNEILDEIAIKSNPLSYIYIKNMTNTMWFYILCKNGLTLDYFLASPNVKISKKETETLIKIAVQQNGLALQYVSDQTDDMCKLAVQENGLALEFVNDKTFDICMIALQRNYLAIEFVPFKSDDLYDIALQNNKKTRYWHFVKN